MWIEVLPKHITLIMLMQNDNKILHPIIMSFFLELLLKSFAVLQSLKMYDSPAICDYVKLHVKSL